MSDVFTTVVVGAAAVANIREFSRRMGNIDLDGMFVRRLSATGQEPATHFISSGYIRPVYFNTLSDPQRLFDKAKAAWEGDGDVFPFTLAQVTTQLGKCTVTDGVFNGEPETGHETIARLGLKFVQEASQ